MAQRAFTTVFSLFFTNFDFEKLNDNINERERLQDNADFGRRYQLLDGILKFPHYNWEYYKTKDISPIFDAIAERIAEKITKKLDEKES